MLPDVDAELDAVCNSLQNLSLSGNSQNLPSSLTTLQRDLSPTLAPPPDELEHRTDSVPPSDGDDALPTPPSAIPLLQADPTSTRSSTTDQTRLGQDPQPTSSRDSILQAASASPSLSSSPSRVPLASDKDTIGHVFRLDSQWGKVMVRLLDTATDEDILTIFHKAAKSIIPDDYRYTRIIVEFGSYTDFCLSLGSYAGGSLLEMLLEKRPQFLWVEASLNTLSSLHLPLPPPPHLDPQYRDEDYDTEGTS